MGDIWATAERAAVLESKLRLPRMLGTAVARNQLLDRMASDAGRGIVVTVVTAPAGAGKTTLLAQRGLHLQSRGYPVAWLSVDHNDNDPRALWSGILTACARAVRGRHDPVEMSLAALQSPVAASDPGFVRAFFRAIDLLPDELWLVLDDIHEIVDPAALDGLARLVTNLPPGLRLLLGCRHDPLLPLQLVNGTASQIRAADLAFDRDEAHAMLSGHDLELADYDLDALLAKTEGWAAGLKLAALSLEQRDDISEYIAAFAGDDHPVADYLVSEVLASQPTETVDFLLTTAIPERLTIELANELANRRDADIFLDRLAHQNVLVVQQETTPWTYRYHSLLRSYLMAEFDRRDAVAHRAIHRKASQWFTEHGTPSAALDHAIHAEDWELVVALVGSNGLRLLLEGDTTIDIALGAAPRQIQTEPVIALAAAMAALLRGELSTASHRLDTVGRDPSAHEDAHMRLLHSTALLYEARLRGDRSSGVASLVEATRGTGADDRDLELLAAAARGMALIELGDSAAADSDLSAAFDLASQQGRDFLALDCLSHLAVSASTMSNFGEMVERAERAVAFATERGWESSAPMISTHVIAAWGAWQVMDIASAEQHVSLAGGIDADVEPKIRISAEVLQAYVSFDTIRDLSHLRAQLQSIWKGTTVGLLGSKETSSFCFLELRSALSSGRDDWADEVLVRARDLLGSVGDVDILKAIAHAHRGRNGAAGKLLAPVLSGDVSCYGVNALISAHLLDAHLAAVDGELDLAHAAVDRAIRLAAPRRALRVVVETASDRVRELLVPGRFGTYDSFVDEALTASKSTGSRFTAVLSRKGLTARELKLLRDLPSLLSLGEIADAHVVSVNTVKSHLKVLYRKLEVTNRREAVKQARELGLL